jgi:acyl-CoA synthetase (NDP forming)
VGITPDTTPPVYERAVLTVAADPGIDAVMVSVAPPFTARADEVARAIASATAGTTKPVVAVFLGRADAPAAHALPAGRVPCFSFPEQAARALAAAARHSEWTARPEGARPEFGDLRPAAAQAVVSAVLRESPQGRWMRPEEAASLLRAYGIRVATTRSVEVPGDAAVIAAEVGFPVALKAAGPDLLHKSDVGGVRLGLATPDDVFDAYEQMQGTLRERMTGAVVQAMAAPGVETAIGVTQDPVFGPVVLFGSGGTTIDLFADLAVRILPLTDAEAADLVRSTRGSPLLFGYRGTPAVDVAGLEETLLRVAKLAEDIPEIADVDLNPVIVAAAGPLVVDAKVRLVSAGPAPELSVRRLR